MNSTNGVKSKNRCTFSEKFPFLTQKGPAKNSPVKFSQAQTTQ